jgi:multisubunit Na+/H+ antiporter MnhC subunit
MMPESGIALLVISAILFATGIYALIARSNLIKMVMGLELLGKSVSLLFILGGYLSGDTGISQAVVFTLIAIEAVVAGLALALVILARQVWKTFDIAAIAHILAGSERR